jgi:hypothetical protein
MPSKPATDDAFFDALRGEDALGAVVRGHIHIEARLQLVLEALTPHPSHLPQLRYEQRVKLAVALGLHERILPALTKLGHIRNAFGHRLDVSLTDAMVDDLFQSLSEEDKDTIRNAYKTTQAQLGLEWPPYEQTDARHKFITIAVALDKFLIVAEKEAREQQDV